MPRGRGRRVHLRTLGRRRHPDLRRPGRFVDQARTDPPRTGRHAHGRWLRARHRTARRRVGDVGPRRHQHGHRIADGADGLGTHDRAHGPDDPREPRLRRLPGGRRHRHHLPRGQAQLHGARQWGHSANHPGSLPPRHDRPAGPDPDRSAEGRHPGSVHRNGQRRDGPARLFRFPSTRLRRISRTPPSCSPVREGPSSTSATAPSSRVPARP